MIAARVEVRRTVSILAVLAWAGLAPACVGENPRWDGRDGVSAADSGSGDADTAVASDGDSGSGGAATSSTMAPPGGEVTGSADAGTSAGGGEDSGTSAASTGEDMMCPPDRGLCDGECRKILTDGHHCGEACLDCDDVPGSNGKCMMGECQFPGEGKAEDG